MISPYEQEQLKIVGDALSISTIIATLAGWLPALSALAALIWTCIRIYETDTVQRGLKRWRNTAWRK